MNDSHYVKSGLPKGNWNTVKFLTKEETGYAEKPLLGNTFFLILKGLM